MAQKPKITGALFPKNIPNGPVFSGVIEIEGVKHQISLWEKTAKTSGNAYLSISEDKRAQGGQTPGGGQFAGGAKFSRPTPPSKPNADMDDDIPFAPEFR